MNLNPVNMDGGVKEMDEKSNLLTPVQRAAKLVCHKGHKVAMLIRDKVIEIKCHSCGHYVTVEYAQDQEKFLIKKGSLQHDSI